MALSTEEIRGIEQGLLLERPVIAGDIVWTPRYVERALVSQVKKSHPCYNTGCDVVLVKGDLHATVPFQKPAYCLRCATWENGTPTGRARERSK